jgi:hypothetical protein
MLAPLNVPQSEAKVREILRSSDSFTEVWKGGWQLGHAATLPTIERNPTDHHASRQTGNA